MNPLSHKRPKLSHFDRFHPRRPVIAVLGAAALAWVALEAPVSAAEAPSVVKIVPKGDGYQLLRNGQPFFVKGACGTTHLRELAMAGGNSIRTYGPGQVLDEAHKYGLTVLVGLNVAKPRFGFDYHNREAVARQLEKARQDVLKYKDHPAVLMWALGNEYLSGPPQDRSLILQAVNDMAQMIKQTDPNHPVITVLAGAGNQLNALNTCCPALDAVGINTYGGLLTLGENVAKTGWKRPWIVTEFGPIGYWEAPKTSWRMPLEDNSSLKAEFYLRAYRQTIEPQSACLGSYVFLWGQKQEKTHTWFGMFLPEGNPLNTVDAMTMAWTGKWPSDRCPQVGPGSIRVCLEGETQPLKECIVPPGARLSCRVDASDPENQPLTIKWDLRRDAADNPNQGGDREPPTSPIEGTILNAQNQEALVQVPAKPDIYRLFVYVLDPQGHAATANLPLLAKPGHSDNAQPAGQTPQNQTQPRVAIPPMPSNPVSTTSRTMVLGSLIGFKYGDVGPMNLTPIGDFIAKLGHSPGLVHCFFPWKKPDGSYRPFPKEFCEYVEGFGATPLITWSPGQADEKHQVEDHQKNRPQQEFDTVSIASGIHDEYISTWADAAKAHGKTLCVRLMHEMGPGARYPWSLNMNRNVRPEKYVTAFRHVVDIFHKKGVANVQFVWCCMTKEDIIDGLFPGDDYVEWISLDGYNNLRFANTPWKSIDDIFLKNYRHITSMSKRPVMIGEVSSVEKPDDPNAKAKWFRDSFLRDLPKSMPRVKAVVLFNSPGNVKVTQMYGRSYMFNTSPQSFAAVQELFRSPIYQGTIADKPMMYGSSGER